MLQTALFTCDRVPTKFKMNPTIFVIKRFETNVKSFTIATEGCILDTAGFKMKKKYLAFFEAESSNTQLLCQLLFPSFKACVHYFLWNFYFLPDDSPSKTMKMFFISSKKLFSFSRYSSFFSFSSSFPHFPHSKGQIKVE